MHLVIKQKYITIGDKFSISDENGQTVFYAREKLFKLLANMDIMDLNEAVLCHMQAKFFHFFSYFEIHDAQGQIVGNIDERMHMPFMRRAKMTYGDRVYKIKGGPFKMKTIEKVDGKWDKKHPVCHAKKHVFKIADTYDVEIDEKRIDPLIGAMIALWYDKVRHGRQH